MKHTIFNKLFLIAQIASVLLILTAIFLRGKMPDFAVGYCEGMAIAMMIINFIYSIGIYIKQQKEQTDE